MRSFLTRCKLRLFLAHRPAKLPGSTGGRKNSSANSTTNDNVVDNSHDKMPPSQLKRLKASLREQGIVGPQKSKKQKKQNAQNGAKNEKRVRRSIALNGIREQFNPFEYKTSARGPKFDVTTNRTMSGRVSKSVKARPGVTRSDAEKKAGSSISIHRGTTS